MTVADSLKLAALISLVGALSLSFTAEAGLKYWTSGGYDADSYVADGLLLNYDGIRNAGLGEPHNSEATTWVNLGSLGSAHNLTKTGSEIAERGEWLENGFRFATAIDDAVCFSNESAVALGASNLTLQFVCDVDRTVTQGTSNTGNVGYLVTSADRRSFCVAVRSDRTPANGMVAGLSNVDYTCSPGDKFSYFTAILGANYLAAFTGTVAPTSGSTTTGYREVPSRTPVGTVESMSLGGKPTSGLTGTINAFRLYSRVLENEELAWNRIVDEARFHSTQPDGIPVTNVVVASSVATVSGNEPNGAYALDASGYEFTAPATASAGGVDYSLVGCTVEAWDAAAGAWGEAVRIFGASYFHSPSSSPALVRLTWLWRKSRGGLLIRFE